MSASVFALISRAPVAQRRPLRFWLHQLFGLQLSLFLGVVCLTGTLATLSHEIEWLLWPEVRAQADGPRQTWGMQWEAARAAHPQWKWTGIGRGGTNEESYLATVVRAEDAAGADVAVYVDPLTAQVQGRHHGVTLHAFLRGLHYYFFVPGNLMFYAVTSLGVVLLGSLVTGLLVYRKFWRGLVRMPRRGLGSRVFWGDLHRLGGLWSTWFIAVIGVTSVWYLIERAGVDFEQPTPRLTPPLMLSERVAPDGATIDAWAALAERSLPGLRITSIYLPFGPTGVVTVQGQRDAWLVRDRTNAVFIDPRSHQVVGVRSTHTIGAAERWVHTADPLHFGNFGALGVKLLWAMFGGVLCLLAFSGALIHAKRTVRALRDEPVHASAAMKPA